jgi:TonB-linked SusC/RagA family outer membrane protein
MHSRWLRRLLALPTLALAVPLAASTAAAQNVIFSGSVTSTGGQPLSGASVGIPDMGLGTITREDGRYSFTVAESRVRGRQVVLQARFIGYKPRRATLPSVTTSAVTQDFSLERDILNLEQVVVTGVSEATSQTKTPFSVSVIDNTQIREVPSVASPVAALQGKVAGASLQNSSGQPGAAPAIRLRSATSLTGRQDPLIIIDGTISRLSLADINSEDIERVEIIKGAAASSLYGSDAANGVIQIFTRRGANLGDEQTAVTFRNEVGQNWLPRIIPTSMHHNYKVDASGNFQLTSSGERIQEPDKIVDNPYPVVYDPYDLVFRNGNFVTNYISVGQRRGRTNYNASFQNTRDQGVLATLQGFRRQNFRVNVDHALSDKLDFGVGAFYARSNADQLTEGTGGPFFGMRFIEPNIKLDSMVAVRPGSVDSTFNPAIKQPPLSGNVTNPLYELATNDITSTRSRFTGTFRSAYRPINWLTFEGNVGYDQSTNIYKSYTALGHRNSGNVADKGGLTQSDTADRAYNINLTATATSTWMNMVRNTTKAAFLVEDQTRNYFGIVTGALSVARVPELTAVDPDGEITPGSFSQTIRARNVFAVTTFDIKDRYVLDALVRRDESSLFGSEERSQIYHRLSGAWRVSEDFKLPGVDEFKLRISHGTAGLRPPFEAQYETFRLSNGVPDKEILGNPGLRPAYSKETEYGLNLSFLQNFNFEYTYSQKRTTDEIIKVPLSAATGYVQQWQNAGTLEGHSHEAMLGAVLLSKADYFWRVSLTGDRTRQKIADLKVGAFLIGPSEGTANTQIFRIGPNEPLGVVYGQSWIRNQRQLEETIRAGGLTGSASDYTRNEEGYYVRTSQYHTINEVPLQAARCLDEGCTETSTSFRIGNVNPDFNLGFNTTAQWKGINFGSTLTWTKGGQIYNYTRQWPFNEFRDVVVDQNSKAPTTCAADWQTTAPQCPYLTGKKPSTYYSAFYNNFNPSDYFVESGTYVRLRELSVNYEFPVRMIERLPGTAFRTARIGLVGRNLWTSTKYSGFDPDVTGPGGGNPFAYRVDYFTYPAYRSVTGMIELGF